MASQMYFSKNHVLINFFSLQFCCRLVMCIILLIFESATGTFIK